MVAPPNEWPTTATLLKSNLPLNGKKKVQQQSDFFYTDWLKKELWLMRDRGKCHGRVVVTLQTKDPSQTLLAVVKIKGQTRSNWIHREVYCLVGW